MQDATAQPDLHSPESGGNLPPIISEPAESPDTKPTGTLKDALEIPRSDPLVQKRTFLPQRGLYYATIAGVIAGVFTALLTIIVTLVFAGTFHAASQQIAVDRLTVKTALALAGLELLNVMLSILIGFLVGFIVGRIAVRRRLGFLAGTITGAIFYLITFLVSLISGYPGDLVVNRTPLATGSLVLSCLLLCLWSISGGLVSLLGAWVATVRHPHYMKLGE